MTGRSTAAGPAVRSRRGRTGRALLAAAGGLTLAGVMLVASLPADGGDTADGPSRGGPPAARAERAQDHGGADGSADEGGDDGGDDGGDGFLGAVATQQPCDNGLSPVESYRPTGEVGDAVRRIQDRGQLIVGVDQNSYRWGYRQLDENGDANIVGFDIDLVKAIAASLLPGQDESSSILYRAIPTAQREEAIQNGDVDMVVRTMSITCGRWEDVAFSGAYFETGQQLLAPVSSGITGVNATLDGATVCAGEETTALTQLTHRAEMLPRMRVITRGNHLDCLVAIQLGQADALMTDSALAAGHAAQDPTVALVGEPITEESYGVAMNLEDIDLVRWVNGVLEDYTKGGAGSAWQRSYATWLAEYMPEDVTPPKLLYRD